MADFDRPTPDLAALERRIKRRIRRHMIEAILSVTLFLSIVMVLTSSPYTGRRYDVLNVLFVVLCVWVPYTLWYLYQAWVEASLRREIEAERAHQIRLAEANRRAQAHAPRSRMAYDTFDDDAYDFTADEAILYRDEHDLDDAADYPPLEKPKRRLSR